MKHADEFHRGDISATDKKAYIAAVLCMDLFSSSFGEVLMVKRLYPKTVQTKRDYLSGSEVEI
jgi:hypothetical protein